MMGQLENFGRFQSLLVKFSGELSGIATRMDYEADVSNETDLKRQT